MKVVPLLPGKPYASNDEPTYKKVDEQAWGCREDDLVGYWA